jgi:hypothetical protein
MKSIFTEIVLPLGILAVAACTRTPLDPLEDDESNDGAGGLLASSGGQAGSGNSGGRVGTGGSGGTGGRGTGGAIPAGGRGGITSGTQTGGVIPTGGAKGGAGGNVRGGAGGGFRGGAGGQGDGGFVRGGAGGAVRGGAGGAGGRGGVGGRNDGGSGGSGGVGAVGGTIAAGGAAGAAATGGTCAGLASNEELIDNLDDGDRFIPRVNGRVGSWSTMSDGTPGGVMSPQPGTPFGPTPTGDPCRSYAAYVKGYGFTDGGATFGFGLGAPYDASKYDGISFWARIDQGASPGLRVAFPDKDTHPDGGICQAGTTGATQCYDHFGMRITLTTTWTKFTIRFEGLTQDGWGLRATAFDPASLFEVLFEISKNATFGIWIDDVAFTM